MAFNSSFYLENIIIFISSYNKENNTYSVTQYTSNIGEVLYGEFTEDQLQYVQEPIK